MVRKMCALLCALVVSASACADTFVGADHVANDAVLFEELWSAVDQHYSFFELKQINWDSLRTLYRPRALAAKDDRELSMVFGQLLRELRDPHVAITPFGAGSTMRFIARSDTARTFFSPGNVAERYTPAKRFDERDVVRAGMVTPAVGYIHIANFRAEELATLVDDALQQVDSAKVLIVDVRDNPGGVYALAVDIAGRFTARRRVFGFLRFRNGAGHSDFSAPVPEVVVPTGVRRAPTPIYLLTNARTVSSAEVFTLALRSNPLVTVVGDTTAGASGGPTARELSNGWIFELSEWIEYTPEHQTYEGIGLAPHIVVKPAMNDYMRKVDPVLERALLLAADASIRNTSSIPDTSGARARVPMSDRSESVGGHGKLR